MDRTDAIRDRIGREGPLSFDLFMEEALYADGGFFDQPPIGATRDFVTAPHIHGVFAHLLGIAVEGLWSVMGEPTPLNIVEFGAGDGTLARQLTDALPGVSVRYTAAERSAGARAQLEEITFAVTDGFDEGLASCKGIFIANELLDNLPFRLLRGKPGGAVELLVDWDDASKRFVKVERPVPIEIAETAPRVTPGDEAAVSLESLRFIDRLASLMLDGYAILIDYGGSGAFPPHGYRNQRLVDDVLLSPGTCDITAGVDFAALAARARRLRFRVFGPVSQHDALMHLGFVRWMDDQRREQRSMLADGEGRKAVQAWSDRQAAQLLVDPSALGRFQWLVLGAPDMPQPPWTLPYTGSAAGREP